MEEKKVSYEFDKGEVNTILAGLGELPAKHTFHLIDKIRKGYEVQATSEDVQQPKPELLTENGANS